MTNIEYITFHIKIPFKKFKAYTEENLHFNISKYMKANSCLLKY